MPRCLFVSSQVAPQDGPFGRFLRLDDEELTRELERLIRATGGVPEPSLIEMSLTVLRADLAANRRYFSAEPPDLGCPVTAIGWTADDEVPAERMTGWARCSDRARLVVLAGRHYEFLGAPPALLAELARDFAAEPLGPAQPAPPVIGGGGPAPAGA